MKPNNTSTGTYNYNTIFGVHSVITEQCYNEGIIHGKYRQWEPSLNRVITEFVL